MDKIALIVGRIEMDDGQVVEFQLSEHGISRWGNVVEQVARTVDPTEAMLNALVEAGHIDLS